MGWQIGDEFLELSKGAFVAAQKGQGTHIWNGSKIVPKTKPKPKKKKGEGKK